MKIDDAPEQQSYIQRKQKGALGACTTSMILRAFTVVVGSASLCLGTAPGEGFCFYEDPTVTEVVSLNNNPERMNE